MGKFLHVRMPWNRKTRKRTFKLETSPGLPQSNLDKKIFHPDWKLRPEWTYEKRRIPKPSGLVVHRPGEIFFFTNDAGKTWNEDDLAIERACVFDRKFKGGRYHYSRKPQILTLTPHREGTGTYNRVTEWGYR